MPNVKPYNYQQIHDRRLAESICVAAVVSVTAFDPAKMTVDVQPLSKHLQNGKYESQPPILSIPVACTRSGGFIIRPWIKAGDVGVVLYLDPRHGQHCERREGGPAADRTQSRHYRRRVHRWHCGGRLHGAGPPQRSPCPRNG